MDDLEQFSCSGNADFLPKKGEIISLSKNVHSFGLKNYGVFQCVRRYCKKIARVAQIEVLCGRSEMVEKSRWIDGESLTYVSRDGTRFHAGDKVLKKPCGSRVVIPEIRGIRLGGCHTGWPVRCVIPPIA